MKVASNDILRLAEQIVLAKLAGREWATRAELAELTNLPRTTVIAATNSLVDRGLLDEVVQTPDGKKTGRPSTRLLLTLGNRIVLLIELGRLGTVVSAGTCQGESLGTIRIAADARSDFETFIDQVRIAAGQLSDDIDAVVVSIPAPFQPGVGVGSPQRSGQDLAERFPQFLPLAEWMSGDPSARVSAALHVPVVTENDANLAALGEARFGAGRGSSSMVHVVLTTGIGAGIVIDDKLFRGATGMAGELAHTTINKEGRLCSCGNRGCLVTEIAHGPLLADQVSHAYDRPISTADVIRLAATGDAGVNRVLRDYGRAAGEALAGLVSLFQPESIVVDSSLGAAAPAVVDGIVETIGLRVQPSAVAGVRVVPGVLNDGAQLMGAVAMLRDRRMGELARSVWPVTTRWSEPLDGAVEARPGPWPPVGW